MELLYLNNEWYYMNLLNKCLLNYCGCIVVRACLVKACHRRDRLRLLSCCWFHPTAYIWDCPARRTPDCYQCRLPLHWCDSVFRLWCCLKEEENTSASASVRLHRAQTVPWRQAWVDGCCHCRMTVRKAEDSWGNGVHWRLWFHWCRGNCVLESPASHSATYRRGSNQHRPHRAREPPVRWWAGGFPG